MKTICATLLFSALIASTPLAWSSSTETWQLVAGSQDSPVIVDLSINLDAALMPPQQTGGVNGVPVDPTGLGFSGVISSISVNSILANLESNQSTAWHANQDTLFASLYPSAPAGIGTMILTSPSVQAAGSIGLRDIFSNMSVSAKGGQLQLSLFSANASGITTMPVTSFTVLPEPSTADMLLLGLLATLAIKLTRSKLEMQQGA